MSTGASFVVLAKGCLALHLGFWCPAVGLLQILWYQVVTLTIGLHLFNLVGHAMHFSLR